MSGVTILDAGVLISYLDTDDAHHQSSIRAMDEITQAGGDFATSAVTISEALVRPARNGEREMRNAYYGLTIGARVSILEVETSIALEIARARAEQPSLKTPDAAVVATARIAGAERILTTDRRLAKFDEAVTVREFVRGGR